MSDHAVAPNSNTQNLRSPAEHAPVRGPNILQSSRKVLSLLLRIRSSPQKFASESQLRLDVLRETYQLAKRLRQDLRQFVEDHADLGDDVKRQQLDTGHFSSRSKSDKHQPSLLKGLLSLVAAGLPGFGKGRNRRSHKQAALTGILDALEWELQSLKKEVRHLERVVEGKHIKRKHRRGRNDGQKEDAALARGLVEADGSNPHNSGTGGQTQSRRVQEPPMPYPQDEALPFPRASIDTVHPEDSASGVGRRSQANSQKHDHDLRPHADRRSVLERQIHDLNARNDARVVNSPPYNANSHFGEVSFAGYSNASPGHQSQTRR